MFETEMKEYEDIRRMQDELAQKRQNSLPLLFFYQKTPISSKSKKQEPPPPPPKENLSRPPRGGGGPAGSGIKVMVNVMVIVKVKNCFLALAMFFLFDVCNNDSYVIRGYEFGMRTCS